MDIRDVSTLPIARSAVDALIKGGFRVVGDLKGVQPLELAQELGIAADIALSVIRAAEGSLVVAPDSKLDITAKDILTKYGISRPVITFCRQIDVMLGGGVPVGQITEFCGVPGVGKTQLGIQLALNVQIPEVFNGLGGEAVYIDTEGSFVVERVAEMAAELSNHLHKLARGQAAKNKSQDAIVNQISAAQSMTRDRFLEGIQIFRVHDQTETIATINHLAAYLKLHTKIRLVVIDSIAFHFRQDLTDTTARSRMLSSVAQTLNQLAYDHNLAVVVVNHVTTRFERSMSTGGRMSSGGAGFEGEYLDGEIVAGSVAVSGVQRLVPALGEQWSHCITNRVMLHWHQGRERRASLVKSPSMPFASVPYCVCERGIRDVPVRTHLELNQQGEFELNLPDAGYTQEVLARDKKRRLEESAAQQRAQTGIRAEVCVADYIIVHTCSFL
jgi:RAD51-like protein 2